MKKILSSVLAALFLFGFFYLLGSFYNVSFCLARWNDSSRNLVAVIGGIASLACFIIMYNTDDINDSTE